MTNQEIVTEKDVDDALTYLEKGATLLGNATQRARKAEHMLKHILALEMKRHDGPISGQEREARASAAFLNAADEDADAAGDLAVLKAKREACAMRIEIWRTQSSNWRSMKI